MIVKPSETSLVIRGPYVGNALGLINKSIELAGVSFKKIIIVCYQKDKEEYTQLVASLVHLSTAEFVFIKDPFNPGFFNLNRQLVSARAGLGRVSTSYVVMLRNDQFVNWDKFFSWMRNVSKDQYMSVNTYSRIDRLYHPSDMFIAGRREAIEMLFSLPLSRATHIETLWEESQNVYYKTNYKAIESAPEQQIFKHYLKQKGWNIRNTREDSFNAIKRYVYIVNSWDIDLRWQKDRNYLVGSSVVILPHYFRAQPFPYGPLERVRCINRHYLQNNNPTMKDIFYISLSRFIWLLWPGNESNMRRKLKRVKAYLKSLRSRS